MNDPLPGSTYPNALEGEAKRSANNPRIIDAGIQFLPQLSLFILDFQLPALNLLRRTVYLNWETLVDQMSYRNWYETET